MRSRGRLRPTGNSPAVRTGRSPSPAGRRSRTTRSSGRWPTRASSLKPDLRQPHALKQGDPAMIARALPRHATGRDASRVAGTVALTFAALLMLLPLLAVSAATAPRVDAASRPTIVLVHGAWAGPDGWDTVVAGLQKDGYPTSTPALGLQSTYADVATVRGALDAIPGNKILVGHTYGG